MFWLSRCGEQPHMNLSQRRERERDSAPAQNNHHRSNGTRVNTVSSPLLPFTHDTAASLPLWFLCQSSRFYMWNLIDAASLNCSVHLISRRQDARCINWGERLFNVAESRGTGVYWLFLDKIIRDGLCASCPHTWSCLVHVDGRGRRVSRCSLIISVPMQSKTSGKSIWQ